jgi:2-dehydropantoate 2-reductase
MSMRICVFGAGSLGSALGALLSKDNDVTLVGRRPHMDLIRRLGLRVTGDRDMKVRVNASETVHGLEEPDLLIISTKAYDTQEAVRICRAEFRSNDMMALTLQNGLGNFELLRSWKGSKAFGGTTTMGAALSGSGRVRLSGLGRTVIGSDSDRVGAGGIASAFSGGGIPVSLSENIQGEIWAKAIVNACINPVSAILSVPNGRLLDSRSILALLRGICEEGEQVAYAVGIELPVRDFMPRVRRICVETSENRSSMLRDIEVGRRTEIREINGAICRNGQERGVRAPLNLAMCAFIEALEQSGRGERLIS